MPKQIFIILLFTLFQIHSGVIAQGIAEHKLRTSPFGIQAMAQIPAGEFTMGSNHGPDDEKPAHRIFLSSYSIDQYPVTNFQFAQFLNVVGLRNTNNERLFDDDDNDARIHFKDRLWQADIGFEDHPVVEVSWVGARDYCLWSGKKLPTEAQWEKAARGTDERKFPWGNKAPTAPTTLYAQYAARFNDTVPVTISTKGASPYGVMDLVGNAWEWVLVPINLTHLTQMMDVKILKRVQSGQLEVVDMTHPCQK
ncbi:MAG: hypothetical protein EBQ70_13805 [Betaproteobacteria bacterium]|nr:hypothetical protein [Betaproteobacteria bacterium]